MSSIKSALGGMLFSQRVFEFFQKMGIHILRKHFYSPIPDTQLLATRGELWEKDMELVGVDLNIAQELDFLENIFTKYLSECDFPLTRTSVPYEYYINNGGFGFASAVVLHCMIRNFAPKTIIEVGAGNSTFVSARACRMNAEHGQETRLISIEPYPSQILNGGFPGLSELIIKKVEDVDISSLFSTG